MGREAGGESGWGIHVNPWLIHVNVWQKPLQYCKVISLQLIKINEKKIKINKKFKKGYTHTHKVVTRIQRTIQKGPSDLDDHDGVVIHLEPDILECEVK